MLKLICETRSFQCLAIGFPHHLCNPFVQCLAIGFPHHSVVRCPDMSQSRQHIILHCTMSRFVSPCTLLSVLAPDLSHHAWLLAPLHKYAYSFMYHASCSHFGFGFGLVSCCPPGIPICRSDGEARLCQGWGGQAGGRRGGCCRVGCSSRGSSSRSSSNRQHPAAGNGRAEQEEEEARTSIPRGASSSISLTSQCWSSKLLGWMDSCFAIGSRRTGIT